MKMLEKCHNSKRNINYNNNFDGSLTSRRTGGGKNIYSLFPDWLNKKKKKEKK